MNACEDETEPLGESPDIDTLVAVGRAAEIGMVAGADLQAARALVDEDYPLGEVRG